MRAALAVLLLAGCSVESSSFAPTVDATPSPDGGDDQLRIVPNPETLELTEGESDNLSVHLSRPPAAPVTVTITGVAGVATVDPSILVFGIDDFADDQVVTVTAVSDVDTGDEAGDLSLDSGGVGPTREVAVTVDDDDILQIVTSTDTLSIGEQGGGDVLVHLNAQPAGDVVIAAEVVPAGPATVGPTSLTFTTENWEVDQTLHVMGVNDANIVSETPTLSLTGDGVPARAISLSVIDDDVLNFSLTSGSVNVIEGTAGAELGVSLTQDPGGPVTVDLTETSDAFHLGATQLSFNSVNYGVVQDVAVIPDDDDDVADETGQITVSATGITSQPVNVSVDDDDQQAIVHSAPGTLVVDENTSVTFTVRLAFRPSSNLTVSISSNDSGAAAPNPGSLVFTSSNFDVEQDVMITGVNDVDLADETPTLSLMASGVTSESIPVDVLDEDVQAIVVSTPSITVTEGDSEIVTARLQFQPPANTTVIVSSTDGAITAMPASLSFTTADYGPRNVTLAAPVDGDTVDETATIDFNGAGASASIDATVDDQTMITNIGWPTYFNNTTSVSGGVAIAYKVTVSTSTTLDRFGVIVGSAGGDAKMALYADTANAPGALVTASNSATPLSIAGTNFIDVPDVAVGAGSYWLAIRVNPSAAVGESTSVTARQCYRVVANFADPWANPLGSSSCGDTVVMNLFMVTYQ